ncbi:branched-chain amino acid ABC transporter permease [Azospirillum sp.]|uniref:branched-chain amino acid ABC transporter permease n=1 Tax=Azospirillum sp. TaxID=34012 RepID=UPI002D746D63|nr:branched-chain amino acid ABC transporter permease [Azospirillum sp.]HYD71186.1 branched-chain amino acid ABC transporter permease [Azospirillum sp.]
MKPFAPLAALAALAALPLLGVPDYHLRLIAEVLIYGVAVMSLDLLIGFGGLVSLGHAAFFGVGAYAAALFATHVSAEILLVVPVAVLSAMAAALVMGALVVRSANLFLLILTLLLSQMVWEVVFRWRAVTGGADGFRGIPELALTLPGGHLALGGPVALYALAALLAVAATVLARSFIEAPAGRALIGTREQPLRMTALGYSVPRIRLTAFVVSAAIAGAAGALYPFVNQYVGPQVAHWTTSASLFIMLVLGGVATLYGGYVGAAIYLGFQTYISSYTERWQLVIGLLFVATVLFVPGGLGRSLKSLAASFRPQGSGAAVAGAEKRRVP